MSSEDFGSESLHDQLRALEDELGIAGNERVRETARNVAGLID